MRFAQKFIKIYIKIEQILIIPPTGCLYIEKSAAKLRIICETIMYHVYSALRFIARKRNWTFVLHCKSRKTI